MKLKSFLKFGLPLVGVAALSVSLPIALTSCSDSNKKLTQENIQNDIQKEVTQKSDFLYYYLSNGNQLKNFISSATDKQIESSNIKTAKVSLVNDTVSTLKENDSQNQEVKTYKVNFEIELNKAVKVDDKDTTKININNIDTGIQELKVDTNQTVVATNHNNLTALAKYIDGLNDFTKIGSDNVVFGKSNSGAKQFSIKPGTDIFKNICYTLNIDPKDVYQGESNLSGAEVNNQTNDLKKYSGIRFIQNKDAKEGATTSESYSLFIILNNSFNWNKTVLKLEHNGQGNGQDAWYGKIELDKNNEKKFVYQSSSTPDSVGYGKNNNAMGIYSFNIKNVPENNTTGQK